MNAHTNCAVMSHLMKTPCFESHSNKLCCCEFYQIINKLNVLCVFAGSTCKYSQLCAGC